MSNVILALHRMYEPQTDAAFVGHRETDFWALALEKGYAARHRAQRPVYDIEFGDFVRDQMGTVKAIYDHFGLELTAAVEAEMQQWLAEHPRNSTSLQRFTPEDFGVPSDALRERFASYRQLRGYTK
jgi:hypothetical protein